MEPVTYFLVRRLATEHERTRCFATMFFRDFAQSGYRIFGTAPVPWYVLL